MKNKALTLTVIANMTSNYGEGLGNIGVVQKIYRSGKTYSIRSRESLKNAIMLQSGLYNDLGVIVAGSGDGKVAQKAVSAEANASNQRALEGGYMNTVPTTKIRKSSFYLTDAISFVPFINTTRFHNNLFQAKTYAEGDENKLKAGLMPYQYEYEKALKCYSMTIDLDKVGVDENYDEEADNTEKIYRVRALLDAVKNLSLVVKGNMDNAEPLFVVGGIGERKTHYFENAIHMAGNKLKIGKDLKEKLKEGYRAGLLEGNTFENEEEIIQELEPVSVVEFFEKLKDEVDAYYEGAQN